MSRIRDGSLTGVTAQVPAAVSAVRVLRMLGEQASPMSAAALSRALGIPRSSTYHLLSALESEGFVLHIPGERAYSLALGAFQLGAGYTRQAPLTRLAAPLLGRLVDTIGETAHLAVLQGRDTLYLIEERAPRRPRLITDVGVRLPSLSTASGRSMLAALDPAQLRAIYPDAAALQGTPAAPSSRAELARLMRGIRRAGHASETEEVSPGFGSVAVAVRDPAGWPVAAIAVTFPLDSGTALPADRGAVIAAALGRTAAELSRRLSVRSAAR